MNDLSALRKKVAVLEKQRRVAWANYYRTEEEFYDLSTFSYETINRLNQALAEIDLPKHLIDEIIDLHLKLKTAIECPICFCMLNKDNVKITMCGHKHCKDCYDRIDNCSICRKKIWKKKS